MPLTHCLGSEDSLTRNENKCLNVDYSMKIIEFEVKVQRVNFGLGNVLEPTGCQAIN